jgi:hypothetical protein
MSKPINRILSVVAALALACAPATAIERRHGVLVGTVMKLDAGAKTAVVKLADGTEHTLHFVKATAVHGADDTAAGATEAFHGLKEGSQVAVHYTAKGAVETADEVDHIGKGGLKAADGTVTGIDRGAKTLTVKTENGVQETYKLTDNAAKYSGKEIAAGSEKSAKVTVYYTEEAGHKVAHFFRRAI